MKIHFINVVWGAAYTDLMLNATLPNTLSAGNLGAFVDQTDCCYRLYTTSRDAERIREADSYSVLRSMVNTELVEVDGLDEGNRYEQMSRCHEDALITARDSLAAVVFLAPDAIWSDGAFRRLLELADAGASMVAVSGLRVTTETFLPEFLKGHCDVHSHTAPITSRALVAMALRHLHPTSSSLLWDAPNFTAFPSVLYWRVGSEGLLQHCFHLHPLMIGHVAGRVHLSGTIDGEFIARACPDIDQIHIVADSDEMAVCTMTPLEDIQGRTGRQARELAIARWACSNTTNRHHRSFFEKPINFHAYDIGSEWGEVEEQSRAIVMRILNLSSILYVPYFGAWKMRQVVKRALPSRFRPAASRLYRHVMHPSAPWRRRSR